MNVGLSGRAQQKEKALGLLGNYIPQNPEQAGDSPNKHETAFGSARHRWVIGLSEPYVEATTKDQ